MAVEQEPKAFPTNWVSKEDLLYCRPDLKAQIEAMSEGEVDMIAGKIGEALQETYWSAMDIVLTHYTGIEEQGELDLDF